MDSGVCSVKQAWAIPQLLFKPKLSNQVFEYLVKTKMHTIKTSYIFADISAYVFVSSYLNQ